MIYVLLTPLERHIENELFGGYRSGDMKALCPIYLGKTPGVKRVARERIPAGAICPACIEVARRWYAPQHFEPFDSSQRLRLLRNLDRDMELAA